MDIKKITDYYEQEHTLKFANLHDMHQFFERYTTKTPTEGEIGYLNSPISIQETESTISNLPKQQALGPGGFTGEFNLKYIPIFYNLFQKIEAEELLPNDSIWPALITQLPKLDKDITRKL